MADTNFIDNDQSLSNRIVAAWLNVVNKLAYWGRSPNFATTTGAANAQVLTLAAGSLYTAGSEADGDTFSFKAGFTNSGAATLQVLPSGGANTAVALQLNGVALTGGEIISGQTYSVTRKGSTWQLSSLAGTAFGTTLLQAASAAAARTLLGLASMAVQAANAVAITGGTISGVAITGSTMPVGLISKSEDFILTLAEADGGVLHPAADTNNRTFTIPANDTVPYGVGTTLTFVNEVNTVTIAITSDTLVLAGAGSTGSRTLAANGMATALKITSTKWMISGAGLS